MQMSNWTGTCIEEDGPEDEDGRWLLLLGLQRRWLLVLGLQRRWLLVLGLQRRWLLVLGLLVLGSLLLLWELASRW
jgi:hypothetical protein